MTSTRPTPENVAVAIDDDCTECETLTGAFQFVYRDGRELGFTRAGRKRRHDLRKRVAGVVVSETRVKQPDNRPSANSTTSTTAANSTTTSSRSTPAPAPTASSTTSTTSAP